MAEPNLPLRQRTAARVLLIDEHDRVLLLLGRDPSLPAGPTWWFTPGGGIDAGEDPVDAVRRECVEELGRAPEQVHGPIAHRLYEFPFDGHWLVQDTHYYWARIEAFEPAPTLLSDTEQRYLLGWLWWTPDALATTSDTVYPADLRTLLALTAEGSPGAQAPTSTASRPGSDAAGRTPASPTARRHPGQTDAQARRSGIIRSDPRTR